jgi:uroporphyrinogen decarboxylase
MMDMATNIEYVEQLFKLCADFQTEIGLQLIKLGVDAIWAGDDFGDKFVFGEKLAKELKVLS